MNLMIRTLFTGKLVMCLGLLLQADTITLFDGETLDGWEGDKRFWSVQDGVITGKSTEAIPCKATTYLVYKKQEFANFELTLSFRFLTESANGGILYRAQWPDKTKYLLQGYQADMATDSKFSGILYESGGRKYLADRGENVIIDEAGKKTVAKLAEGEADKALQSIKQGEWNEYRVVADGKMLMHQINGHTTMKMTDNEKNRAAAGGWLALQMHHGVPVTIQYKDVKMLELVAAQLTGDKNSKEIKPSGTPQWVWAGTKNGDKVESSDAHRLIFTKKFEMNELVDRFYIGVNADDSCIVKLNGRRIIVQDGWQKSEVVEVANLVGKGVNKLRVEVVNKEGRAGFIMQVSDVLVSDDSWKCETKDDVGLVTYSQGDHGVQPWGKVLKPLVWEKADDLQVMDGFKVEKIHKVDKATEGSWVAMCFDNKGDLYVSDQYGALFRITLKDGKIATKKKLAGVGHAQGLCWAYDSLYMVSSNRETPGVYRLTDSNNDGEFDKDEIILSIVGGGEHGTHGLIKNPNGEGLLLVVGNHTDPPEGASSLSNGNWAEDTLHPHLNDASGHAVGKKAPAGTLILMSPDGKDTRIIARGMRNTYDIAASSTGEVFGYDSDMEYDVGTPWYKPTRVLHFTEGAEFGWRTGTAKWPAYYADSLGSVIDIGPGCPTGVVFGTGAKFPARYQKALFVQDWTFGRIYALHLKPDGVTYSAEKEVFVSGKPLPLTDMTIGPDGSMYFLTGGRRLRSGLYRVTYTGSDGTDPVAAEPVSRSQKLLKRVQQTSDVKSLWKHLGSKDRTLRYTARVRLELVPVEKWLELYKMESDPQTLITVGIALARREVAHELILEPLLKVEFDKLDEAMKLEYLRAVSLACIRSSKPAGEIRTRLLEKFSEYPSVGNRILNRELCRVLVYLDSETVLKQTLLLMENSVVVKEKIPADLLAGHDKYGKDILKMLRNQPDSQGLHYALMLKNQKSGWNEKSVTDYCQWLVEAASKTGGNSYKGFIKNIRKEAMQNLTPELVLLADRVTAEHTKKLAATQEEAPVAKGPGRAWTHEEAVAAVSDLSGADKVNGGRMFKAVLCARCHTFAGNGGSSGPELTQLANRFSKEDILKAIIDPSEVISDQYVTTDLVMKDGSIMSGKIMKEDDESIHLAVSPYDLTVQTQVNQADVQKRVKATRSTMPPSLINSLSEKELKDLMLYLTESN